MAPHMYASIAAGNRAKTFRNLREVGAVGVAYLKGGVQTERKWTDVEGPFRQESNFFYLTGVQVPGCHLLLDLASGHSHLFIPNYGADYTLWCGQPPTLDEMKTASGVEHASTVDNLRGVLEKLSPKTIHIIDGETELDALGSSATMVDSTSLKTAITEARVIKSEPELKLMREAARISGEAHIALMKAVRPGVGSERQLHALMEYECFRQGGRFQAYTPIVAAGRNGAILHYVNNDGPITTNGADLLLVDAACEFECYAADITRTYPIGGKFEGDWKTTYEICLAMQKVVLAELKDGVEWEDMHRLAERVAAQGLLAAGLIKGSMEDIMTNHIPALFFPHGLGHLIGLDVHDVGGYPKGVDRIAEPGIKYLRMRRTLRAGMVVTVEPGIYFVDQVLDEALADAKLRQYLDEETVQRFRSTVGGVRIEDDVVILPDGIENLTDFVPKEISDIEAVMTSS